MQQHAPPHPEIGSDRRTRPARRRHRARAAAATLLTVGALTGLAACGSDDETTSSSTAAAGASSSSALSFTPSPGTDIPKVKVRFAMWPYGDTTIAVPGIEQGWFDEVGISLPNGKRTRTVEQTQQELMNDQLDIASGYVPNMIQTYASAQKLKMIHLQNSYIGNYVWSKPSNGDVAMDAAPGADFNAKAKAVLSQLKGKKVGLSDTGGNREFFNTVLKLGGLTPKDVDLTVVSDTRIVQLAKSGAIDYAFPQGAAQSVEVQGLGYKSIFAFQDMVEGLPKGDERVMTGIGHAGLQASEDYVAKNRETVLRFMSVFFRIIDGLQNEPQEILKVSLPTLRTSTGVDLTLDQAVALFKDFYGTTNFEQAAKLMLDPNDPLYYEMVYKAQIAAAKAGGIIPRNVDPTPDDLIIFKGLYQDLVTLKKQYDQLLADEQPTGELADKAKAFYEHRDYLDAYRFLKAATEAS